MAPTINAIDLFSHAAMKKVRQKRYTALEDSNFHWDEKDIRVFREMWKEGYSCDSMAVRFDRPSIEIAIILLDQMEKGFIKKRRGGVDGNDWRMDE